MLVWQEYLLWVDVKGIKIKIKNRQITSFIATQATIFSLSNTNEIGSSYALIQTEYDAPMRQKQSWGSSLKGATRDVRDSYELYEKKNN